VVSSPALGGASCAKPRGVTCAIVNVSSGGGAPAVPTPSAYFACGQPDNAVLLFKAPILPDNIVGLPTIESVNVGSNVKIRGTGFAFDTRLEVLPADSATCLTFEKEPKLKKKFTFLLQKGRLSDGRKPGDLGSLIIRLIAPDGTVRLLRNPVQIN
jgi:hypothetical protein